MQYRKVRIDRFSNGAWGATSKVVDEEGNLLPVYRGQHGLVDHWEESLLGSLSFGSAKAANGYALNPNDSTREPQAPKVYPVFLDIRNPFIESARDPFLDLSRYAEVFGEQETQRLALKFKAYVEHTDYWSEVSDQCECETLEELVARRPDRLQELYFVIWPLLDDADEVARLRSAGFDGAIYGGSGATAMETEYRVFCPAQVRSVWDASLMMSIERTEGQPFQTN